MPRKVISVRNLGSECKIEIEAVIDVGGDDPTSSVLEKQPTVEGEVSHGSPEQRLTKSKVVCIKEVRQIMNIRGEQKTVVAEGSRNADSGDSDIVLSHFLGKVQMFWMTE